MTTTVTTDRTTGVANGSAPIPFYFQALSTSEVGVKRNGVDLTSGYTVQLNGDGTGKVTPSASWGNDTVVIYSKPRFDQPANFDRFAPLGPEQIEDALDRLARGMLSLKSDLDRTPRFAQGGEVLLNPGQFLTADADGKLIATSGTGSDGALRADLAASTALGLIGTPMSKSLQRHLRESAIRPVRGIKAFAGDRMRAFQEAERVSNPATSPLWGFAAYAGTTGGWGYTETINYDHDGDGTPTDQVVPFVRFVTNESDDEAVVGSARWALAQVRAKGGGYVIVHPRGNLRVTLTSHLEIPNNCTFIAPGRNIVFHASLSTGTLRFYKSGDAGYGTNIIVWGIEQVSEGGGLSTQYDQKNGEIDTFAIIPELCDRIALVECTASGATDGFFDISGGATPAAPRYFSVLSCAVRNTDKVSAIGTGADTLADAPRVFVTIGRNHFDGCSQRKPMASSRSYVHFVNNVDDGVRKYRDYTDGSSIGTVSAANARNGGRLRYEANIVRWGTSVAGRGGAHGGVSNTPGAEGAALLINNYFDPDITATSSFNAGSVEALPPGYNYPLLDVTSNPAEAARIIIDQAGAGRTNFPRGLYAPVDQVTGDALGLGLRVNGEQVVWHEGQFWVRVAEEDRAPTGSAGTFDALNIARGGTLTMVGTALTLGADRVAAVNPPTGTTTGTITSLATITPSGAITKGLIFLRTASSNFPIALVPGGNLNLTVPVVLNSPAEWVCLFWNGAGWDVFFASDGARSIVTKTATANPIVQTDAGRYIRFTNASATTYTLANDAGMNLPLGTEIEVEAAGAGGLTIVAGTATVLHGGSLAMTNGQGGRLKKVAPNTFHFRKYA